MPKEISIVFISSTGGHLSELLQLAPLFQKYTAHLITEQTPSNQDMASQYPQGFVQYLRYGTKAHLASYVFVFAYNILKSFYLFFKYKPDFVITTGTHTAVPMCYIAHIFHKKVIWIETMANAQTATKAGQLVYPIADLFVVQWEEMKKLYPKAVYGGWIF